MAARIQALKNLFKVRRSVTGTIVKINEQGYHVSTDKGVQICHNLTATAFHAGDSVRVVEGGIIGGITSESRLPTFLV